MIVPFKSVTVPVDLSETADQCIAYVLEVFKPDTTAVYFCSVVDSAGACYGAPTALLNSDPLMKALEVAARSACDGAVTRASERGFFALGSVGYGATTSTIDRCVRANRTEAIVISTYSRIGLARLIAGTFAEGLLESTNVPIIVTHVDDELSCRGPIAVALDGSGAAAGALQMAIRFARENGQGLSIFCVAESGAHAKPAMDVLEDAAAIVREAQVDFELVALEGNVADAILENARRRNSPMIVIGTHGRPPAERIFLGSVVTAVIERARVPVTVVPL
jgi:nucleotide-binding universal stress UspA family protein